MKKPFFTNQDKPHISQDLHYICNRVRPELLLPYTPYQSVPSAINLRHAFAISKRIELLTSLLPSCLHDAATFSKVRSGVDTKSLALTKLA